MKEAIFIASPLVGAGIGYVTNWIAIKMLFRPLRPVTVLGKEISFLQGVIPKRHKDLARSIGQTVGEHLLTEDAFEKVLQSPETREAIRRLVREGADALQNEGRTIDEIIALAVADPAKREGIYLEVNRFLQNIIIDNIRSEKTIEYVSSYVSDFFTKEHNGFADSDFYAKLKYLLGQYLSENLQNPIVAQRIYDFLSGRVQEWQQMDETVGDVIPEELVNGLKLFLLEQGPRISEQVTGYLNSAQTKALIRKRIDSFFGQGFLMNLVGRFADKGKITEQVIDQISAFVNDPANQAQVLEKINTTLNGILHTRVADLAKRIDEEKIVSASVYLADKLASSNFVDTCLDAVEDIFLRKATANPALLEAAVTHEWNNQPVQTTNDLVKDIVAELLRADFVEKGITKLVNDQLTGLRGRPVKSFFTNLKLSTVEKAENSVLTLLDYVHRNYLGRIIGVLNFEQLVEEKILSYDLEELEALVLRVMSVELKAITWFGLYLGLLMGFITPLINLIFGG